MTKTQIKALVAAATAVIRKEYPKAKDFRCGTEGDLEFDYFNEDYKTRWNGGFTYREVRVPVDGMEGEFPECCGYGVLTGFKANPTPFEKAAFTVVFHGSNWVHQRAGFFAVTANQPGADAMLLANGFELIHTAKNPGSGNVLRSYIYKVPAGRSRR
jgi:hypothetical protein